MPFHKGFGDASSPFLFYGAALFFDKKEPPGGSRMILFL